VLTLTPTAAGGAVAGPSVTRTISVSAPKKALGRKSSRRA
jgi:hypothetical protein